ncbi:MAG TPA: hypothetical protein GYA08_09275 [Chloroflexi bacterium]|nr:hypothetical protein [Chloroflexota bacterium]
MAPTSRVSREQLDQTTQYLHENPCKKSDRRLPAWGVGQGNPTPCWRMAQPGGSGKQ